MLSLQGNTAVYLLYAHARIAAIGRKAGIENIAALAHDHPVEVDHEKERALAMHVSHLHHLCSPFKHAGLGCSTKLCQCACALRLAHHRHIVLHKLACCVLSCSSLAGS